MSNLQGSLRCVLLPRNHCRCGSGQSCPEQLGPAARDWHWLSPFSVPGCAAGLFSQLPVSKPVSAQESLSPCTISNACMTDDTVSCSKLPQVQAHSATSHCSAPLSAHARREVTAPWLVVVAARAACQAASCPEGHLAPARFGQRLIWRQSPLSPAESIAVRMPPRLPPRKSPPGASCCHAWLPRAACAQWPSLCNQKADLSLDCLALPCRHASEPAASRAVVSQGRLCRCSCQGSAIQEAGLYEWRCSTAHQCCMREKRSLNQQF